MTGSSVVRSTGYTLENFLGAGRIHWLPTQCYSWVGNCPPCPLGFRAHEGSVTTCLRRGGIVIQEFVADLLPSPWKNESRLIFGELMGKSLVCCFFVDCRKCRHATALACTSIHVLDKVPLFCRYLKFNFLKYQCITGRKKPPCQKQINSFIPFERTPTYDRHGHSPRVLAMALCDTGPYS